MKRYPAVLTAVALTLLAPPPLAAAEAPKTLRITCPETWPGPESRGARLSWSTAYFDTDSEFGPDDSDIAPPYDTSTLLDCAYGNVPHIHAHSPLRITVAVPGHARRCRPGWQIADMPVWCDTVPDADGTIGPIRLYVAERITLATSLLGFGLRQDRDEIAATASKAGFACTEAPVGGDRTIFHCGRDGQQVAVHLRQGRSTKVEVSEPSPRPGQAHLADQIILRIGLRSIMGDEQEGLVSTWQEPGSPARITIQRPGEGSIITLSDTSATE